MITHKNNNSNEKHSYVHGEVLSALIVCYSINPHTYSLSYVVPLAPLRAKENGRSGRSLELARAWVPHPCVIRPSS